MDGQFWRLSGDQAGGLACVVCGIAFTEVTTHQLPVGRSEDGDQVFACAGPCALAVAEAMERMAREMREAAPGTRPGDTFALTLGGEGAGEYGALLRDLRLLVGAEALLCALDDVDHVRFALRLAALHAESVVERSRLVLSRLALAGGGG